MSDSAIQVVNLGKQFHIGARQPGTTSAFGHRPMLHERLTSGLGRLLRAPFKKKHSRHCM